MSREDKLKMAWNTARSAPNNKLPHGTYIGTIRKSGRDFKFYEVENGQFQYMSYAATI